MIESFQILATLAAARVVVAMAPGPTTLLVGRTAATSRRKALAVAAGVWSVGLLWAGLALMALATSIALVPDLAPVLVVVGGLHLVGLGVATVRRAFADAHARHDAATPGDLAAAFAAGITSEAGDPRAVACYLSIFAVTGALELDTPARVAAVAIMPTVAFVWNALMALAVAHPAAPGRTALPAG